MTTPDTYPFRFVEKAELLIDSLSSPLNKYRVSLKASGAPKEIYAASELMAMDHVEDILSGLRTVPTGVAMLAGEEW